MNVSIHISYEGKAIKGPAPLKDMTFRSENGLASRCDIGGESSRDDISVDHISQSCSLIHEILGGFRCHFHVLLHVEKYGKYPFRYI